MSRQSYLEVPMHNLTSLQQIESGHVGHWFDRSSRRFFSSRISGVVYPSADGSAFFVSSERSDDASPRLYSVRRAFWEGGQVEIETVGEFQQYASRSGAHAAARRLASAA